MFIIYSTAPINHIFVDWYWILKIKYNGYTLNSRWPIVIFCQALEKDYLYMQSMLVFFFFFFFLIGIHSMQGWTATTRHGAYWGGFRTLATFKMKHFVTKKLANAFPKKYLENMLRKKWTLRQTNIHKQTQ